MVLIMAKCMLTSAISSALLFIAVQSETFNKTESPECLEISTFHEASNNITSPNYPQPYPTGCAWEWTINATGKTQLHVSFQSFDINDDNHDQLSTQIFEGEKEIGSKKIIEDGKEITLRWDGNERDRLVEIVFKAMETNITNTYTGFNLFYELSSNTSATDVKHEVGNTSTDASTKNIIQTDTENIAGIIVVNLDGKTTDEFLEEKDKFCEFMADLARAFCKSHNISSNNISNSSVFLNSIVACSNEWPESELCISVNLSISVSNKELTSTHLNEVWNMHSPEKLLSDLGLKEYIVKEDGNFVLVLWLATTGTLFLLFIAILVVVLRTKIVENYIKRTRREHLGGYGVYERSRFAQPNQQLVPPFFYPDERIIDQKNFHQYGAEPLNKNVTISQENPAFEPDNLNKRVSNQISQEAIDDFDSDDDTIYPPSPLARQSSSNRPHLVTVENKSNELETAF